MKLYQMSMPRTAVPRGRGMSGGAVYHTCSCSKSLKGGGAPLLLSPPLGTNVGGAGAKPKDMTDLRMKMEKITMNTPKRRKYISL